MNFLTKIVKSLYSFIPVKYRVAVWVILAFISVGSFFNVNSAWADANDKNTLLLVIGVITGIIVALTGVVAAFESEPQDNKN